MVDGEYVPERGDLIWVEFTPQAGHEQSGRRPALIVSPSEYNLQRGLALVCPISTRIRGYRFEVPLQSDVDITGVVLSDQIKSADWRARYARYAGKASPSVVDEAIAKITALLGI